MRAKKLLFAVFGITLLASSCYTEVILDDDIIVSSAIETDLALQSYDLWYIDLNATQGSGEVPFMERAFTLSFVNGLVYANNNMVGFGKTGDGLGIDVGAYSTFSGVVDLDHDIDGAWTFDVYAINNRTLELYNRRTNTSYFLNGYQTRNFDYDRLFYENLDYFLQEYEVWEKSYTSEIGAVNEFDEENFLRFFPDNGGYFQSSVDSPGTPISSLQWDYEGDYGVFDTNDATLKTLTLDYDYLGNDYFELYVINDSTIELYHVPSETIYEFTGRGYIQYLKSVDKVGKKRSKVKNKKMNVSRKRKM
ncbi:nicotinic acid mononucleotide adenyltransferase [Croceivirga thetidis]|uniref:Nicotinic acid mononucleotide adenyltransferase n=1 Tax=Croceivirga thetidis TaxID=2721623 RepID=A0ABX1GNB7_9FLAO|nr:nicotinic acid mononucleotide adenyltransferase [Croceivirga thetidis]NKI31418.1 nicotinic acid mononucleotide adenyltransferase [Croceivirga thetidis]